MGFLQKLFGKGNNINTSQPINFTASKDLMDEEKFWNIISTTIRKSKGDFEVQQEKLGDELQSLSPDEIILFGNRFRYFRGLANTWELWGAIYIIHGGCGDDSFNDFREWVIAQGKDFYYRTIKDPSTLIEIDGDQLNEIEWEGMGYIPSDIFEKMTGQEMPYPFKENLEVTGNEWKEEDLTQMYPELCAKYPDNI